MSSLITKLEDFSAENIVFSEIKDLSYANNTINFKRILIGYKLPDGPGREKVVPLILSTGSKLSWGVRELGFGATEGSKAKQSTVKNYGTSVIFSENDPFVKVFEKISERCTDHVMFMRNEIGKPELERSDLGKIAGCMYVKGDKRTLYPKLTMSGREIVSTFFDMKSGIKMNPLNFYERRHNIDAMIKFDNIYVGKVISLQAKVCDARVSETSGGRRSNWMGC